MNKIHWNTPAPPYNVGKNILYSRHLFWPEGYNIERGNGGWYKRLKPINKDIYYIKIFPTSPPPHFPTLLLAYTSLSPLFLLHHPHPSPPLPHPSPPDISSMHYSGHSSVLLLPLPTPPHPSPPYPTFPHPHISPTLLLAYTSPSPLFLHHPHPSLTVPHPFFPNPTPPTHLSLTTPPASTALPQPCPNLLQHSPPFPHPSTTLFPSPSLRNVYSCLPTPIHTRYRPIVTLNLRVSATHLSPRLTINSVRSDFPSVFWARGVIILTHTTYSANALYYMHARTVCMCINVLCNLTLVHGNVLLA